MVRLGLESRAWKEGIWRIREQNCSDGLSGNEIVMRRYKKRIVVVVEKGEVEEGEGARNGDWSLEK